jgi:hypothetical protein
LKKYLVAFLLCASILGLVLTGLTVRGFYESYSVLRTFSADVVRVTPQEELGSYEVEVSFSNAGNVSTQVEAVHALLYWEKKLIATTSVSRDLPAVPAGRDASLVMRMSSNLDEQNLPDAQESAGDGWMLRLHLRIGLPEGHTFRLDFDRKIAH